jgi:hypothetical protein
MPLTMRAKLTGSCKDIRGYKVRNVSHCNEMSIQMIEYSRTYIAIEGIVIWFG